MWPISIAERPVAGAILVVVGCLIGVASTRQPERTNACRFDQTWYAGDVHYSERIEVRSDSAGVWIETGAASDARRTRKEFTWERTDTTLAVVYDGDKKRTVDYRLERRRDACYLTFSVHPFLADDSGFHQFADYP